MKLKIIILFLLLSFITSGCQITKNPDQATVNLMQPISLNVWGVWDESDNFTGFIKSYKATYPFVDIQYRRFRYDEYEKELINAFATDRGPDIFAVHNTWIREYATKGMIAPLPEKISMARLTVTGTVKKDVVTQKEVKTSLTTRDIKSKFIDVVYHDVVVKEKDSATNKTTEKIYGLPLYVDTLAMFYNKDLFNNAGITSPPLYWDESFQQYVKKLTKQDNKGQIIQSGVALGGSNNIERSSDILSALMMQDGAEMTDSAYHATFNSVPAGEKREVSPGAEALRFYTDFANPAKEVYCWNGQLPNSLDLFAQGKLAMLFGYSYMLPTIKANGPKVNFAISFLPQIQNRPATNYANYWAYAVSQKILTNPENLKKGQTYAKQKQDVAWDFVQYIANESQVKNYLEKTKRPTALRSLIDKQKEDENINIFADQLLTAKSWYQGLDPNSAEAFFKEMIDNVVLGKTSLEDAIGKAISKINQIEKQGQNN
ncbi:MAG: extracellular solute-binding protein [Candidatus Falkowbacteria bacterium]|nr:extracellular solute-binding protein [Candidatus Falkowbacteria bacterium]